MSADAILITCPLIGPDLDNSDWLVFNLGFVYSIIKSLRFECLPKLPCKMYEKHIIRSPNGRLVQSDQ